MREEVMSSGDAIDPSPAASPHVTLQNIGTNYALCLLSSNSSAGASSPAVPTNVGSIDWSSHGHGSKAASLSCIGSQQPRTSLSTSAGGSALGSSRTSCRPWERGDLLRRLATFKPSNWFGKPKVASSLACAQRGWINVDVDKIMCESCGAYLSFVSLPSGTPAEGCNLEDKVCPAKGGEYILTSYLMIQERGSLSSSGLFSVKSFFLALSKVSNPILFLPAKFLWSSKAPSKVKALAWLVTHGKMVWQERNNRIFEDKGRTEEMLWDLIRFYSSLWTSCTEAFRGVPLSVLQLNWIATENCRGEMMVDIQIGSKCKSYVGRLQVSVQQKVGGLAFGRWRWWVPLWNSCIVQSLRNMLIIFWFHYYLVVWDSWFLILPMESPTALVSTSSTVDSAGEAFGKELDTEHKVNCPWRGNSCPESMVQFPPTPQSALIGGYKDRCDGLLQFPSLPIVAASAVEQMRASRGSQIERLLSQSQNFMGGEVDFRSESIPELEASRDGVIYLYSRAQKLISLCGWEPRWLPNVQDCEEHSAQSARNGCSFGPTQAQVHLSLDPGPSKNAVSASAKKDTGKNKMLAVESRCESRSPLLDCSLCGATVRIWDFLTVPRPARFAPNSIDIPDTSKKMALTRGASAASGVSGWVAADDMEKEQTEDRDEVATTNEGKLLPNTDVDLNLTMAGGLSFTQMGRTAMSENMHDADMGRDLMIGQPSGSEVGDRAASYESRGPSSRKRSLEIGASSDDRPHLRMQQADSIEGTVIDRDGDEVTDGRQYSAGPSKRARDSDIFDTYCSPYNRDSSGAGPSHSLGFEIYADANKGVPFRQGSDQVVGISSARDSTRASSVIAMDTIGHSANENSMESVENYPGDIDDVQFPSSSIYGNLDMNDTSEMNYSNQAQQSICFQPAAEVVPGEMGVSSTNDGEEIFNAEIVTAQARDGFSFGISGGSVGMCASHEAEIHGTDISVHRADSVVGDVEPRTEDAENQGQTGESAPGPGLMDEIVPRK
ncbi:hypothetical protein CK203_036572 [Vitis vinifera]|uniref:C3HC-type domain-containing protein n=1 Tax=Vitis vinifera TaxID=29760 RepID=A0A438HZT5_VITVI|nr:hypothetical protein CK203_036572 [Vitis vinifera]